MSLLKLLVCMCWFFCTSSGICSVYQTVRKLRVNTSLPLVSWISPLFSKPVILASLCKVEVEILLLLPDSRCSGFKYFEDQSHDKILIFVELISNISRQSWSLGCARCHTEFRNIIKHSKQGKRNRIMLVWTEVLHGLLVSHHYQQSIWQCKFCWVWGFVCTTVSCS